MRSGFDRGPAGRATMLAVAGLLLLVGCAAGAEDDGTAASGSQEQMSDYLQFGVHRGANKGADKAVARAVMIETLATLG